MKHPAQILYRDGTIRHWLIKSLLASAEKGQPAPDLAGKPAPEQNGKPQLVKPDEIPAGLDAAAWSKIQDRLNEQALTFASAEDCAYSARNNGKSLAMNARDTGLWELFLSTFNYRELSGGFGGPEYQPAKE